MMMMMLHCMDSYGVTASLSSGGSGLSVFGQRDS